jgi:uncharacterized protein (TIGR02118 family)
MESKTYWKILLLLKRKPGMSKSNFRSYYEDRHIPLCLPYMSGVSRYFRRYLEPQPHPENGLNQELPFDVITEMWFDDEEVFKATLAHITTTVLPDNIVEDERNFFDRPTITIVTATELETVMK